MTLTRGCGQHPHNKLESQEEEYNIKKHVNPKKPKEDNKKHPTMHDSLESISWVSRTGTKHSQTMSGLSWWHTASYDFSLSLFRIRVLALATGIIAYGIIQLGRFLRRCLVQTAAHNRVDYEVWADYPELYPGAEAPQPLWATPGPLENKLKTQNAWPVRAHI